MLWLLSGATENCSYYHLEIACSNPSDATAICGRDPKRAKSDIGGDSILIKDIANLTDWIFFLIKFKLISDEL